jgi:hypothetical protein
MRSKTWMGVCAAANVLLLACGPRFAQAQGNGHGHWHDKSDDQGRHEDNHGRQQFAYRDHDREMRSWYHDHESHLPPGLAKRDRLPPGLEKQLVVRGTLPPGLRKQIVSCPPELVRVLPPPPPDCVHVVIGGNLVLVNRQSWQVVDVFHFNL